MTDEKKKMTAQGSSVGADDGQSISKTYENSIPTSGQKGNNEIVNSQDSLEEMYRKIQRITDPRYLHTLTMTELFQTTYKSRPPVVEGLLYAGAYIGRHFAHTSIEGYCVLRQPSGNKGGTICSRASERERRFGVPFQSVRKTRSHRMKFCVQKGLGGAALNKQTAGNVSVY
jgi:hypothetical protein